MSDEIKKKLIIISVVIVLIVTFIIVKNSRKNKSKNEENSVVNQWIEREFIDNANATVRENPNDKVKPPTEYNQYMNLIQMPISNPENMVEINEKVPETDELRPFSDDDINSIIENR